MNEQNDGALLRRVAAGDQAAFDVLWERHAPFLLIRLKRRAPNDAADLLQETFLAAWRNAAAFRGEDAGAWLWTIASRRLIDLHRRSARQAAPTDAMSRETSPSSEDEALAHVFDPRLQQALAQLSPELTATLQATLVDGLSYREAAILLGVAEGTVKARVSRARALMRERLAHPNRPVEGT